MFLDFKAIQNDSLMIIFNLTIIKMDFLVKIFKNAKNEPFLTFTFHSSQFKIIHNQNLHEIETKRERSRRLSIHSLS